MVCKFVMSTFKVVWIILNESYIAFLLKVCRVTYNQTKKTSTKAWREKVRSLTLLDHNTPAMMPVINHISMSIVWPSAPEFFTRLAFGVVMSRALCVVWHQLALICFGCRLCHYCSFVSRRLARRLEFGIYILCCVNEFSVVQCVWEIMMRSCYWETEHHDEMMKCWNELITVIIDVIDEHDSAVKWASPDVYYSFAWHIMKRVSPDVD